MNFQQCMLLLLLFIDRIVDTVIITMILDEKCIIIKTTMVYFG